MSDTDQPRIRASATPWRSQTLQARVAAATLTRKPTGKAAACWPPVQDAPRVLTAMSFNFPPQGGGEEPEKDVEIDAEAVSKGRVEPDESMPEPEEPS
jgi:hypothetical protein